MVKVYLSRRNLLTLLSKLDRRAAGEVTECTILKHDNLHPVYPQTEREIAVIAVEDEEYYTDRNPGAVHPKDENRKPPETRDEKITRLEEENKLLRSQLIYGFYEDETPVFHQGQSGISELHELVHASDINAIVRTLVKVYDDQQ